MPKSGSEYEIFVRDIYQALLKSIKPGTTPKVEHNQILDGMSEATHQVDVYFEITGENGDTIPVILECKDYAQNVPQEKIFALKGKILDIPNAHGVLVVSKGVQAGVLKYAAYHDLDVNIVRPAVDSDYEGRLNKIILIATMSRATIQGIEVYLNEQWFRENFNDNELEVGEKKLWSPDIFVDDIITNKRWTLLEIEDGLSNKDLESGVIHRATLPGETSEWTNAYLTCSLYSKPVKIKQLVVNYTLWRHSSESSIGGQIARGVIIDALKNATLFINEDGTITGDLEDFNLR